MSKPEKMHAAIYRARMTEETFQILLDVMDKHFAALSLPDPASDPKITRAISFSELPTARRILIEQCYKADSGDLVRQYSCEQIFDKSSNSGEVKVSEFLRTGSERCLTNAWTTTLPFFGALQDSGWHNVNYGQTPRSLEYPKEPRTMESMEVEEIHENGTKSSRSNMAETKPTTKLSTLPIMELNGMSLTDSSDRALFKSTTFGNFESPKHEVFKKPQIRSRSASPNRSSDRGFGEIKLSETKPEQTPKCNYDETKKKLRSLVPEITVNPNKSKISYGKFIFFVLLSISAGILAILVCNENPNLMKSQLGFDALNITNLSKELHERVYGQTRAIEELTDALAKSSRGMNLAVLIGGTGVGKSYTTGIVAKHFSSFGNVLEYSSPIRKTIHEAFVSLSQGGRCNLVVLENLKKSDFHEMAKFVKFLKEHTRQICVCIVGVFNPQNTEKDLKREFDTKTSVADISSFLEDNDLLNARIIAFDSLGDSSLDACIGQAARDNNLRLSQRQIEDIRESLLIGNSGCKGAYAKVQLLVES